MTVTARKSRKKDYSEGITQICAHDVEWWLNAGGLNPSAQDIDCIVNCLIDNCVRGEINTITPDGKEAWGWWKILFE
jgi:hypothetical protein